MTPANKALLTKELNQASAALLRAFNIARTHGDLDLAASVRKRQKDVADEITKLNGGPLKLTAAELLR